MTIAEEISDANERLKLVSAALRAQTSTTTALYKQHGVTMPTRTQRKEARQIQKLGAKRKHKRVEKKKKKKKKATLKETMQEIIERVERKHERAERRKAKSDLKAAANGVAGSERVLATIIAKRKRTAEQGDAVGGVAGLAGCRCGTLWYGLRTHSRPS